jgi:tetratricopeptide (TPR) repeat protein/S1-C subfamily serine protease
MKKILIAALTPFVLTMPVMASLPSFAAGSGLTLLAQGTDTVKQTAQGFTVKILVGDTNGSGVIIGKTGNTYRVVTNAHVVTRSNSYKIQAPDGKVYTGKLLEKGSSLQGNDLAILTFESSINYAVATLVDEGTLKPKDAVYSAGFPIDQSNFMITSGTVTEITSQPLKGGYQLGYSADTLQGMSGGPLLNSAGQLIGIVGMGKGAALTEAYTYQDESRPTKDVIDQWRGMSFAVPVATINQITGNVAKVPSGEGQAVPKAKNYTGIVKKVDDIAQQVTVRIDGGDGSNGSGVIIGKNKNRYYILTNKHVVYNKTLNRLIATKVITPDGKEQAINPVNIELMKGDLDLAVVSFDSVNNYQVATLGKYPINFNLKNVIFTHGFSSNKPGKYIRQFTAGGLMTLAFSSLVAKDEFSLKNGYQLAYTNFSYFGMSGGPILDQDGQVIGINGAAENELMTNSQGEAVEVPLGFSLGIPINTFLSAVKQTSIEPNLLNISTKIPPDISQKELELLVGQVSALEMPSASANAAEWLQYGSLLLRVGRDRDQEARMAFDQALRLNPKSSQAYYLRSFSYSETEKKEKENEAAIADLYQALQLDPGFEMAWRMLVASLNGSEKYEEALKVSNEMIRRFPKSANSYFFKFVVLRSLDKKQEALDSLNKAIELEPSFLNYIMRVITYHMPNDYQKAIADLDKVIELNPNYLTAYYLKAVLFQQKGDIQNALKEMNQLRKQTDDPNLIAGSYLTEFLWKYQSLSTENKLLQTLTETDKILNFNINNENFLAIVYWFRASQYFQNNDLPKALVEIDKSFRYKIDDPYLLRIIRFTKVTYLYNANTKGDSIVQERIKLLSNSIEDFKALPSVEKEENEFAQILFSLDFPDRLIIRGSVAELKNIIGNDPNTLISGLYRLRGDLYKEQKKFDLAVADYNTAIELTPKEAVFYNVRGNLYYSQKKWDLALADYNQAIQIDPKESASYYNRANIYYSQDKFDLALADLSKVIELDPKYISAYLGRGFLYEKQKKFDLALADYNQAILLDPQFAEAYANRGVFYKEMNNTQQAIQDLKTAAQLFQSQGNMANYQKALEILKQLGQ